MKSSPYMTAKEAAALLDVSLATLYSYVSRGLLRSEETPDDPRQRRYLAADVRRLAERKAHRRDPAQVAREALRWGSPVLESKLTLIHEGKLYYRGQEVSALARTHSFESVATLLWTGDPAPALSFAAPSVELRALETLESRVARMQMALTLAGEADWNALDLRPPTLPATGARILGLLTHSITGTVTGSTTAEKLANAWNVPSPALLNAALIVCADHELNPSSFTARIVASAEATLYAVVSAGLSALSGLRHGGNTRRVAALVREAEMVGDPRAVVRDRLQRGEPIPGFGHHLYPNGDPRARLLLAMLAEHHASHPTMALGQAMIDEVEGLLHEPPNVDFALVLLGKALHLPPNAALALFALGRAAGWIAHAVEQYASQSLIRPRAVYTGEEPNG